MVDRTEHSPLPEPRSQSADREPTREERENMIRAEMESKAHAEREAVGERARATIQRQEGESERRHNLEDREREMGIRGR